MQVLRVRERRDSPSFSSCSRILKSTQGAKRDHCLIAGLCEKSRCQRNFLHLPLRLRYRPLSTHP